MDNFFFTSLLQWSEGLTGLCGLPWSQEGRIPARNQRAAVRHSASYRWGALVSSSGKGLSFGP